MPIVQSTELDFSKPSTLDSAVPPAPSLGETMRSAFRLENDILAMGELLAKPEFEPEEGFDLKETIRTNGLWDYRGSFLGVQSGAEFSHIQAKLKKEEADRQTLGNAGWTGIGSAMLAGLISPTTLLPLTSGARGVRAIASGAKYGLISAGGQELVLHAAQETRTGEESFFSIATTVVLGAILGGAAGMLGKGELDRIANDMYRPETGASVSFTPASAGAKATAEESAGGLKPGAGMLSAIGPITRGIDQDLSPVAQFMTAQFGTAGLRLEKNALGIPSAAEGTIEKSIGLWDKNLYDGTMAFQRAWENYQLGEGSKVFKGLRADASGALGSGKLGRREFAEAVGKAMFSNDQHAIPEVAQAAAEIRAKVYDPLFAEAQRLGVIKLPEVEEGVEAIDPSYFNRLYNDDKIDARLGDFIDVLSEWMNSKFMKQYDEELTALIDKRVRDVTRVEDMERTYDEVIELRKQFEKQIDELDGRKTDEQKSAEERISTLRREAQAADRNTAAGRELRRAKLAEAREARKGLSPDFSKITNATRGLRQRLKNLNRNVHVVGERFAAKLEKYERLEQLQLKTLDRVITAAKKVERDLEKYGAERIGAQVEKLKGQFAELGRLYDDGEARLRDLLSDDAAVKFNENKVLELAERQDLRAQKMDELAEKVEDVEALDDAGLRAWIAEGLEETKKAVNDLNSKRALRRARLDEQAKALDPKLVAGKADEIRAKMADRELTFSDRMREIGADSLNITARKADFTRKSKELAQEITDKVLGVNNRLQGMHLILDQRGPELARMLDIPSNYVSKSGVQFSEFLVTDVEKAMRAYVRTLSSDIEVTRKFGSADAKEWFKKLREEEYAKVEALKTPDKEGNVPSAEQIERQTSKITKEYKGLRDGLEALLERARGTRGVPKNPRGYLTRAGRTMMNLNVLRYMGGVTISSIPDVARPVQKYGLTRTFKDGFLPFITNAKKMKLSKREAKLAAIGLDPVLHSRAYQMYDMLDEYTPRSKVERGIEYATSRMGTLALFDYWTAGMKQLSSGVAIAKLSDSLALVMEGKGSAKAIGEATEFLAASGIGKNQAPRIWEQFLKEGGSDEIDGVRIPNTDAWDDLDAVRAFRAALRTEVDDTIITPGFEKPLWIDGSLPGRMVGQFKSFAFSSTTKTLMAGLQQRDAAFVQGTLMSLAMGAVSYYLWAVSTGGQAYEDMMEAGIGKWADEAITRSGNLAALGEVQRVAENIPALAPYATFSGARTTRRAGADLTEALLGPSFDLLEKANSVIVGLDDPTQSTLHSLRLMTPLQNLFFLRRAFDAIESAVGSNLPERRGQ